MIEKAKEELKVEKVEEVPLKQASPDKEAQTESLGDYNSLSEKIDQLNLSDPNSMKGLFSDMMAEIMNLNNKLKEKKSQVIENSQELTFQAIEEPQSFHIELEKPELGEY